MRFVQIKSTEQQGRLMLHRARDLLMRQRTQVINAMRAHLAELGIVAAQGRDGIKELLKIIASEEDARLPVDAHASLVVLAAGLGAVQTMIRSIEKRIMAQHRSNEASQRLETIPGIGVIGATAIAATAPDPKVFGSGRDFAAWIGLVPRETPLAANRSSGRSRNGAIAICDAFWWSEPARFWRSSAVWRLAARLTSFAQKPERVRRIGVLMSYAAGHALGLRRAKMFTQALQDLGWTDGQNTRIDYRWPGGDIQQIQSLAKELVGSRPDVVVGFGQATTAAFQQATRTIPIVFGMSGDPVAERGLFESLARPGGNATGFLARNPRWGASGWSC